MNRGFRHMVCIVGLAAFAQAALGATDYWTGATDSWWNKAGNWSAGVPTSTTYTYVDNGGTLLIDATITATADSFYLGEGGRGKDTGGTLTQSGGSLAATNQLDVVAPTGKSATYTLTGGSVSAATLWVAGPGTTLFDQSGGTVSVTGWLTVGSDSLGTKTAGTYNLSGTGTLGATEESTVGLGAFFQSSGSNSVSYLEVASGTIYTKTGGTLTIARGWRLDGTLDFGHTAGTISVGDALVDLSQGAIVNGNAASGGGGLVTGAKSMVILPVGFNDQTAFPGGFAAPNLTHVAGTTMDIQAGQEWNGWGQVDDYVTCAGTIDAVEADGWLTLKTGLSVSGNGSVNLRGAVSFLGAPPGLYVQNDISGMTGGQVTANDEIIGYSSPGTFTQSAGTNATDELWIGSCGTGVPPFPTSDGTYVLSGTGSLTATSNLFIGDLGNGTYTQTGGTCSAPRFLQAALTNSIKATISLSGGTLTTGCAWFALGDSSTCTFTHTGGTYNMPTLSFFLLGYGKSSTATYDLSDPGVLQLDGNSWESIGRTGKAIFTQASGTHSVGGHVIVGGQAGSEGQYNLQGGSYTIGEFLAVAGVGIAKFTQTGGTNTVDILRVAGCYTGGDYYVKGSSGVYLLQDGQLTAGDERIGHYEQGTFQHSAGKNTVTRALYLGDGSAAGNGTYTLSGPGTLAAVNEYIGNDGTGTLTQTAGTNTATGRLDVAENAGSVGLYDLSGTGTLKADSAVVGGAGVGRFVHEASAVTVAKGLALGTQAGGSGTYRLDGTGALEVGGQLQIGTGGGTARFEWFAGTISKAAVALGANGTLAIGFDFKVADLLSGALLLDGGTVSGLPLATIEVTGGAQATQNGDTLTLGGLRVGGPDPGAPHTADGTYTLVSGTLTVGTLEVSKDGAGTLDIQDPAAAVTITGSVYFGAKATFTAAAGTTIHLTGSFFDNRSSNPAALAGLNNVTLVFEGGGTSIDTFEVACPDIGPDRAGLQNGFALHGLTLGGAAIGQVQLADDVDNQTGAEALYVENLTLGPGSYLDLNGLNLYCLNVSIDPTATIVGGNVTLLGKTISGYVRDPGGTGLAGVAVNGVPIPTATDANGYYCAGLTDNWSGTVTPQLANHVFDPTSRDYTNVTSDQADQDYTAYAQWSLVIKAPQGSGTTDPTTGTYVHDERTSPVEVKATAAVGWTFSTWTGDAVPTGHALDNPISIACGTAGQTKNLQAVFLPPPWTLVIQAPDGDGTTYPGTGTYTFNVGVSSGAIQATPGAGVSFLGWSGDAVASGSAYKNPVTIPSGVSGQTLTLKAAFGVQTLSAAGITNAAETATGESAKKGTLRVSRNYAAGNLNAFFTLSGTATYGSAGDYTVHAAVPSGGGMRVTIPAGQDHVDVTVVPVDDTLVEGPETVILALTANAAYAIDPAQANATITLQDNEPTVSVAATDASELGLVPGTFTVTRAPKASSPLTVTCTVGGTAKSGTNYNAIPTSVTIPADAASATLTVTPKKDGVARGPLTVILTATPGALYSVDPAQKSATLIIADDEPIVRIEATQPNAAEQGPVPGTFTVTRSLVTASALTVKYTIRGTATNGTDYAKLATSVTIPANAASATITVTPKDDVLYENPETVILTLAGSATYSIDPAQNSAKVTIADNEPIVRIEATQPNAAEQGPVPGTFTVTRSLVSASALTVKYTISGTATNGTDYAKLPTTVTIPTNTASATVTVTPKADLLVEAPETVTLTLGASTAYGIDPAQKSATATIADSNPVPTVAITSCPATVARGGKIAVAWTVSAATAMTVNRVEWGTAPGSFPKATASDKAAPYQATFAAPTAQGTVYLKVRMTTTGGLNCYSDVQQVTVP